MGHGGFLEHGLDALVREIPFLRYDILTGYIDSNDDLNLKWLVWQ